VESQSAGDGVAVPVGEGLPEGVVVGRADLLAVGFLVPEALGLGDACFVAVPDGLADADGVGVAVAVAHAAELWSRATMLRASSRLRAPMPSRT
jgi:hypothetical protein